VLELLHRDQHRRTGAEARHHRTRAEADQHPHARERQLQDPSMEVSAGEALSASALA
jgi:hypothetical protein